MKPFMYTVLTLTLVCTFTLVLSKPAGTDDVTKEGDDSQEEADDEDAPLEDVSCPNTFNGKAECIAGCMKQGGSPTCCTFSGPVHHCQCLRVPGHYIFQPSKFFSTFKAQMSCATTNFANFGKSLFSWGGGNKDAEAEGGQEGTAEAARETRSTQLSP